MDRIQYLMDTSALAEKLVTIVGVGSGGAPVCDHLAMNGVRHWAIFDPDILDPVNLVKHPRQRKDLGRPKAQVQAEWITDRNPSAVVSSYVEDVVASKAFPEVVAHSDLVLSCTDKQAIREFISDVCVEHHKPCITASIFRTGFGGEAYCYLPGETGCYRCLELFAASHDMDIGDDVVAMTDDERERIYGLGVEDYSASGLSIDIQSISLIQARMALLYLLGEGRGRLPQLKANWVIFGNRPMNGVFRRHFENKLMLLKPQRDCWCRARGRRQS